MGWSGSPYSVRFPLPEMLEVGKDNVVTVSVYQGAALATVTAATVTLYNASGGIAAGPLTATIVAGVPTATVPGATLATLARGDDYRISWLVTIAGEVFEFDNECGVVRRSLPPVVTDLDLYARCSSLDPANPECIHSRTGFEGERQEAWVSVQSTLLAKGRRPHLVLTPGALREVHQVTTLAIIFEGLATRNGDQYADRAADYRQQAVSAWSNLRLVYDETTDTGKGSGRREPTVTSIWLGSVR